MIAKDKKILVSYSSLTGNTKYLAEGLFNYLKENSFNVELKNISKDKDLDIDSFDIICHGYWVRRASLDDLSKIFLEKIENKKIFLFSTCGVNPKSNHANKSIKNGIDFIKDKNDVLASVISQGRIDPKRLEKYDNMDKNDPHYPSEERRKNWEIGKNHPNADDLSRLIDVFSKVISIEN